MNETKSMNDASKRLTSHKTKTKRFTTSNQYMDKSKGKVSYPPDLLCDGLSGLSMTNNEIQRPLRSLKPQQQKTIIDNLLVTKNSTPQKNYSHVPCKFFKQGACQAGDSCPFSHSLDIFTADQTPCKYFQRGHCKFGSKCVNGHILPDGSRINQTKNYQSCHPRMVFAADISNSTIIHDVNMEYPYYPEMSYSNPLDDNTFNSPQVSHNVQSVLQYTVQSNNMYLGDGEKLIPNELSDLLTSVERKRRNSRPIPSLSSQPIFFCGSNSLPSNNTLLSVKDDNSLRNDTRSKNNLFWNRQRNWSISTLSSQNSHTDPSTLHPNTLDNYYYQDPFHSFNSPWNRQSQFEANGTPSSHSRTCDRVEDYVSYSYDKSPVSPSQGNKNPSHDTQFLLDDLHQQAY